jgi:spore germination cell wall hydrolase CwlJ-like protein
MSFPFRPPASQKAKSRYWAFISLVALGVMAVGIGIALLIGSQNQGSAARVHIPEASRSSSVRLDLPPPDLLRPITPEEAIVENAKRGFSARPDTAAAAFLLKTDPTSRSRAVECLTQAVYYEAASEGADGERAVAQIVLNRMRHPAYPSTVCGVVYQGSEKPTGCQFTFTCDGSLARPPIPSLWKQAQQVAEQALAGKVFAPVGHATHYHADFVLPYWADSLDKSVQVGRHIFYRLKGGLGAGSAFRQRYGGIEPLPTPATTVEVALDAVQNSGPLLTDSAPPDPLNVSSGELIAPTASKPELAADTLQGTLVIDGDGAPRGASPKGKTAKTGCSDVSDKQLKALPSNDLRAGAAKPDC